MLMHVLQFTSGTNADGSLGIEILEIMLLSTNDISDSSTQKLALVFVSSICFLQLFTRKLHCVYISDK